MKWFRWYRGTVSNPKLAMVAKIADHPTSVGEGSRVRGGVTLTDVIAVWAVVLEDAAKKEHWGVCVRSPDYIATVLRWYSEEVQSILDAMCREQMIEENSEGFKVLNWHEYQYTSDFDPTSAQRQKRYYDRHKRKNNAPNKNTNALASRPDTDSETDTEAENISKPPSSPNHIIKNNSLKTGEGKAAADRQAPKHGQISKAKGRIFIHRGTPEWEAYQADYTSAHTVEPTLLYGGIGAWFSLAGEPKNNWGTA